MNILIKDGQARVRDLHEATAWLIGQGVPIGSTCVVERYGPNSTARNGVFAYQFMSVDDTLNVATYIVRDGGTVTTIPGPEGRGRLYEIPRSEVQDLTRTLRSVISDMCRHISPDAAAHAMRLSADTGERCTVYYGLTNGKGSIFVRRKSEGPPPGGLGDYIFANHEWQDGERVQLDEDFDYSPASVVDRPRE